MAQALVAGAGGLPAQTVAVFPADHVAVEGRTSDSYWPFAAGVARGQMIYANWRFAVPNGAVLQRIGVRPDAAGTGPGHRVQMEVWMGHHDPAVAVTNTFDNNYAAPAVRVFNQQMVNLPTVGAVATGPQPTSVWLPLDQSFTYDAGKDLVVDYRLFANDNGNNTFVYDIDKADAYSPTSTFGTACPTSSNLTPLMSAGQANTGRAWQLSLTSVPANTPGVLVLGVSNTTWNGLPLPLSLTPLGATGCSLSVAIDATVPIVTGPSGTFSAALNIPPIRGLYGSSLYVQSAVADLFANRAGFVTSNGAGATIGTLPQATLIAAVGSATAVSGAATPNHGIVSVFEY